MRNFRRAFGAMLMALGGFLLVSTLLSLGTLLQGSPAPLWLILTVTLLFLLLFAGLLALGLRLWRGEKEKHPEKKPEEEKAATE